jgi:hypothetical protein
MSQLAYCPFCGINTPVHAAPADTPNHAMYICKSCNRSVPAANPAVEEKAVELCLNRGLPRGVKYYWEQKNQETGAHKYSLRLARENVEKLLAARGLMNAVKKRGNNGWLIGIILLSIVVAIFFYFSTH